jgi:hypothetical protein
MIGTVMLLVSAWSTRRTNYLLAEPPHDVCCSHAIEPALTLLTASALVY